MHTKKNKKLRNEKCHVTFNLHLFISQDIKVINILLDVAEINIHHFNASENVKIMFSITNILAELKIIK